MAGRLAQLEERLVYTQEVGSSRLSPPTMYATWIATLCLDGQYAPPVSKRQVLTMARALRLASRAIAWPRRRSDTAMLGRRRCEVSAFQVCRKDDPHAEIVLQSEHHCAMQNLNRGSSKNSPGSSEKPGLFGLGSNRARLPFLRANEKTAPTTCSPRRHRPF